MSNERNQDIEKAGSEGNEGDKKDQIREFLEEEYQRYWDFLQYEYDVRDKYVQYFLIALGALGGLVGTMLKDSGASQNNDTIVVAIVIFVLFLLSFFTFIKVLYERKTTTESRKRLNGLRRRILMSRGVAKENDDFSNLLLPRRVSAARYRGGDAAIRFFITLVTAFSFAIFCYFLFTNMLPFFFAVVSTFLVFFIACLSLYIWWEVSCSKWTLAWGGRPRMGNIGKVIKKGKARTFRAVSEYQKAFQERYNK